MNPEGVEAVSVELVLVSHTKVRSGTVRQFQIQRHEIDAVVVEDSQGCVCILRREDVEVLLEDLGESRAGSTLIEGPRSGRSV